jgi:hypothetical protein
LLRSSLTSEAILLLIMFSKAAGYGIEKEQNQCRKEYSMRRLKD